jgi:iron complex outermembrane recepter protein
MAPHNHRCLDPAYWAGVSTLVVLAGMIATPCQAEPPVAESQSPPSVATPGKSTELESLLDLPLDQLAKTPVVVPSMDVPVTSVTKEASTVGRSAAAVFVITNEMIRRSGATCIPEALRMAPGLDVAQINSSTWAISCRGFNGIYASKLLVLIDGRTVYTPVSSGVYWDVQDVLLEDVERIEVIRGPGGTLWGANAVNGVISVITKRSQDTQGVFLSAGGGTVKRSSEAARFGGKIGEDGYYRVYGKYFDQGPYFDPTQQGKDAWNQGRFGFRADWDLDRAKQNTFTVQGDHYTGYSGMTSNFTSVTPPFSQMQEGAIHNTGENVLMRYRHVQDEDSDWTLQTYYDQFDRGTILNSEKVKTGDVDLQYRFRLSERHSITCGAGYRYIHSFCPSESPFTSSIQPPERSIYLGSQFVQDEISLSPNFWTLTLGCKIEQNPFTDFEYQPTARLLYTPDNKHSLWGAVSRAVRMPAIFNQDLFNTAAPSTGSMFTRVLGNAEFRSEVLYAYELGFREQMTDQFSWDIATFYNVYDSLLSTAVIGAPYTETDPSPPHSVLPLMFTNRGSADTYGVELATNWSVSDRWRLSAQYTFLQALVRNVNAGGSGAGDSPLHQCGLRSSWDLRKDLDFDLTARYVDCLPGYDVPSYITMDLRLAWRARKQFELAVVGQNLLQPYHYEFGQLSAFSGYEVTEVPRGVYGTVTWKY